jgi:MoxR-like ATPase
MKEFLDDFFPTDNVWPKSDQTPPYIFDTRIKTAVKVALITRRPLLISGSPGCGKTTLAKAIAQYRKASYLEYTFTSRSRLEDLTGEIDQLQRLHDAQVSSAKPDALLDDWCYYKPGLFWWGFDPELAMRRGGSQDQINQLGKKFRQPDKPMRLNADADGVVFLLDEIDKAEPDLPNDLLEPLDNLSFQLPGIKPIKAKHDWYLVVITTNGERDLPSAFLRRCIALDLPDPEPDDLVKIAEQHLQATDATEKKLLSELAAHFKTIADDAKDQQRRQPGTSEYLDAVKACRQLSIFPDNDDFIWQQIAQSTLRKFPQNNDR